MALFMICPEELARLNDVLRDHAYELGSLSNGADFPRLVSEGRHLDIGVKMHSAFSRPAYEFTYGPASDEYVYHLNVSHTVTQGERGEYHTVDINLLTKHGDVVGRVRILGDYFSTQVDNVHITWTMVEVDQEGAPIDEVRGEMGVGDL